MLDFVQKYDRAMLPVRSEFSCPRCNIAEQFLVSIHSQQKLTVGTQAQRVDHWLKPSEVDDRSALPEEHERPSGLRLALVCFNYLK